MAKLQNVIEGRLDVWADVSLLPWATDRCPLTRPWIPPESGPPQRQRQEAHLPVSSYPQCIAEGANWSTWWSTQPSQLSLTPGEMVQHQGKVRGKRNVYEGVKFKLSSDKTDSTLVSSLVMITLKTWEQKHIKTPHPLRLEYIFKHFFFFLSFCNVTSPWLRAWRGWSGATLWESRQADPNFDFQFY